VQTSDLVVILYETFGSVGPAGVCEQALEKSGAQSGTRPQQPRPASAAEHSGRARSTSVRFCLRSRRSTWVVASEGNDADHRGGRRRRRGSAERRERVKVDRLGPVAACRAQPNSSSGRQRYRLRASGFGLRHPPIEVPVVQQAWQVVAIGPAVGVRPLSRRRGVGPREVEGRDPGRSTATTRRGKCSNSRPRPAGRRTVASVSSSFVGRLRRPSGSARCAADLKQVRDAKRDDC
jgi:hypothetical protein